jgi:hypothetical protein
MSVLGGKAEVICSARVFRLLTQMRHWPAFYDAEAKKIMRLWCSGSALQPRREAMCVRVAFQTKIFFRMSHRKNVYLDGWWIGQALWKLTRKNPTEAGL